MKKILFTIVFCTISGITIYAQNVKRPDSYNYQRGIEAIQEEKMGDALEYFNKDIGDNPKSGYPYMWVSYIYLAHDEYGKALDAANMAIKLLPKKDTEYLTFAYGYRSKTYLCLGDTVKALADCEAAIKVDTKNTDLYNDRAQIYYEQKKYALADADYRKMTELKPGDVMGYMGLGRNANAQEHWEDAIKHFDYVTKLSSEYSSGYSFRAESYIGLEKWNEATDDIVKALSLDWDRKAHYLAVMVKEPAFTMLVAKLKVQSAKAPNEATWPYIIGTMYEQAKDYNKAIDYYTQANSKDASEQILQKIATCHYRLGNYEDALTYINKALNMDSTNVNFMAQKANIYYESGDAKAAVAEWDKVMVMQPEYGFGYYRRGWFKELAGDLEGGLEDLTMAIVLEPKESYFYGTRGDLYKKLGKAELAEVDFRKVIELEDSPEKYECIQYAYEGLGMYDKAKEAMDIMIARDSTDYGNYYDAACMYSRMKDKENALKYLEKALMMGYNRFAHIERDFDLDFLRSTDEFKVLIEKYKGQKKVTSMGARPNSASDDVVADISEIPFEKENGVCKVKCKINGLPLHFVFDTGASDVTLSMVEATFMMKNGYLTGKDVVGSQRYMDANGDVSVGTIINIRDVDFGGHSLKNVRASVVRNQKAPLLLGQSVLGRLGKIEIDNSRKVLKITQSK
jgi:clan AA aspartic protease (TIGR02281 family)